MRSASLDFLQHLLSVPSPSGAEVEGQRAWLDYVRPFSDEVHSDSYGNCWAVLNPQGSPKVMVAGHADELAFLVTYIDNDGFVYFQPAGGQDPSLARGQRVVIHGRKGAVKGLVGLLAIHMQDRDKKPEVPKWEELFIDIGAASKAEAEKRVAVGDFITFSVGVEQLHGETYVARACDNRIGTFIAAEALRLVASSKKKPRACFIAASTIQEENGLYGAHMVGYSVHPDVALVVDVGQATDIPPVNKKRHGDVKQGQGPILAKGSVNHPVVVDRLVAVAKKAKVPVQWTVDPRRSGTDADAIFQQKGGIPTAAIGVPNRYMHSPVETIHLRDLENTAKLTAEFALNAKKAESFHVKI
ncbi:MAG: M42 family metallopeptidase [Verrucomicrobiota bacterium]